MWHLKKEGLSDATVETKFKILKLMSKNNVNLDDPEAVKLFIARRETWSNGHRQIAVYAYDHYAKMMKIQWTAPFYRYNPSIPFVPTEKEVDALISACSKKISTTLLALKETGFRIGELWNCKWTDLDEEKSTLKCKAEKHGNPREIRISAKLMSMLNTLPKANEYIFSHSNLNSHRWRYDRQKTALSKKLQNPRLKQIHFHTLRHFYATKLFNETKNLILVKQKLGHRNINSTMVYTHIVEFDEESQNYHHATAKDDKEAGELIDNGWTYICTTPQKIMMFRKRK
ncbi:MAG: tyrosine-type recombinase/integrase [Candidatus Bathyarchaeota archaeon]|nr:tyrosine-type recombinase/integrase [Candidatus Bathyarchaeota archaeon]